jgi:hypothetical protein
MESAAKEDTQATIFVDKIAIKIPKWLYTLVFSALYSN